MDGARLVTRAASRRQQPATSMASISSEGSGDNHPCQEDIAALTHDVRHFKEALGGLRKTFGPDKDKQQTPHVTAHERLGEVMRILRGVLDRYPALQSNELLLAAGSLIQQVKGCNNDRSNPKECFEAVDQLALAFSSRVSEYLMGDLDTNTLVPSPMSTKTKSCECMTADLESMDNTVIDLIPQQIDNMLLESEQGVEYALHRAKLWAKYAKDIMMYIETRAHLEMSYTKKLSNLAANIRRIFQEEINLPIQDIYCNALDNDMERDQSNQVTSNLLIGNKFIEPLNTRRTEHEKARKELKKTLRQEMINVREAVRNMNNARQLYMDRHKELSRYRDLVDSHTETSDDFKQAKLALREEQQKFLEAENNYKVKIAEANEQHARLESVKMNVLQQVREMIVESDEVMKTVTIAYFQLQHTLSTPLPLQFKSLCERSRSYQAGSEYVEFVRKLPKLVQASVKSIRPPFSFQPYSECVREQAQEREFMLSTEGEDAFTGSLTAAKMWSSSMGSDTDSICSSHSNKSHDTSPINSPRLLTRNIDNLALADELEEIGGTMDHSLLYSSDLQYSTRQSNCLSKAAETHSFRKLKSPSRCRECDSYVYFQGVDCSECGLACHKKCMENLAIQCGHRRLPRKMTTFGVDIGQHLAETSALVPHIMLKCMDEIDSRGLLIKGIYRVSGVKSRVEKLCQAFENGADLVDLSDIHPNVVASVLKLYLRQLPEPLLTFRLYPEFVRIGRECPLTMDEHAACHELAVLVKKLPYHLYLTLSVLMRHLHRVSHESVTNNMPASNLGIVFGPTLLRTSDGCASLSSLEDTVNQTRVVELMIQHADEIFSAQDEVTARETTVKAVSQPASSSSFALARSFSFMDKIKKVKDIEPESLEHIPEMPATIPKEVLQDRAAMSRLQPTDELPYFLLPEDSLHFKTPTVVAQCETAPSIFRGSLKDYQGLEGVCIRRLDKDCDDSM